MGFECLLYDVVFGDGRVGVDLVVFVGFVRFYVMVGEGVGVVDFVYQLLVF